MLLFSLPTIGTLIVNSTYVVADGFFISNYIGAEAFAAATSFSTPPNSSTASASTSAITASRCFEVGFPPLAVSFIFL